jgi:hypothetical protein
VWQRPIRRFALPGGEAHGTHAPALINTLHASAPPDQAGRFGALAARDSALALRERLARRMAQRDGAGIDHQPWPAAIQL